jgi:hypothetical protein
LLLQGLLWEVTSVFYSVGCTAKMNPWHYNMNKRESLRVCEDILCLMFLWVLVGI